MSFCAIVFGSAARRIGLRQWSTSGLRYVLGSIEIIEVHLFLFEVGRSAQDGRLRTWDAQAYFDRFHLGNVERVLLVVDAVAEQISKITKRSLYSVRYGFFLGLKISKQGQLLHGDGHRVRGRSNLV